MLKYKFKIINQDGYRAAMKPVLGVEGKEVGDPSIITDPAAFQAIIDAYHAEPEQFTWTVTVDGDIISVVFVNDNATDMGYQYKFDYNILRQLGSANTLWKVNKEFLRDPKEFVDEFNFVNMFQQSFDSKIKEWGTIEEMVDLKFYLPKDDCPMEDMVVVVPKPLSWTEPLHPQIDPANVDPSKMADTTIIVAGDMVNVGTVDQFEELIPSVTTTSTPSNGFIKVDVTTDIGTLYLEPEVGSVSKTKLEMVDGHASFKVITTGLETGDVVSVKFNTKYWTNVHRFTHTIE